MTINARLTPPKGGTPAAIEVKGSRTNLTDLVNQLADKVTHELKLGPATAWNPADEANQYFEEAGWAFKWGMLKEAQAACEASWSLGKKTRAVAELRIRLYRKEGDPVMPDWHINTPTNPIYAPDVTQLGPSIHALQLYQQGFQDFLAADASPDRTWQELSQSLFDSTFAILRKFYLFPNARRGREEDLAELRGLARETVAMLNRHPACKMTLSKLASLQVQQGNYWQETPDEYMELCREFVRSNLLGELPNSLACHRPIAWKVEDQQRSADLRRRFVQELCASTNALTKVDGLFLDFADSRTDQEYKDRGIRFYQMATQYAYPIVAAQEEERLLKDIGDLLAAPPRGYFASPVRDEIDQYYRNEFWPQFASNAIVEFLETDDKFNPDDFGRFAHTMIGVEGGDQFLGSRERVKKVLSAMDGNKARIVQRQKERAFVYDYRRQYWFEVLSGVNGYQLRNAFIYGVDLNSFQTEAIELPIARSVLDMGGRKIEEFSTGDSFELIGDFIYFNGEDKIRRYSLRTKSWQDLPAPVQGRTSLTALNGRLFIITSDRILEMNEDGKGAEILASARRRPAVNQWDVLPGGHGPVFLGPDGSLRLCVNGKVYSRNQDGNDWSELLALPEMPIRRSVLAFDGGIAVWFKESQFQEQRLWLPSEDQSSFELALVLPANRPRSSSFAAPPGRATPRPGTPLMGAALQGDQELVELLLAKGARIEQTDNDRETVLLEVAKSKQSEIVKLLIAKGANVNAKSAKRRTALFYAAYNGELENIKLLLAAGADPNAAAPDADNYNAPAYDPATVARRHNHPLAEALIKEAQTKAAAAKQ